MAYRKANLEHAAASAENLLLTAFLMLMLSITLLGIAIPEAAFVGLHPATPLMFLAYLQGMRMVSRVHEQPMWIPIQTRETRKADDTEEPSKEMTLSKLWLSFPLAAFATAASGWLLARSAVPLSIHTGLSQTMIDGIFTGLAGSLPEFVTALAAVRMGCPLAGGGRHSGRQLFRNGSPHPDECRAPTPHRSAPSR